MTRLALFFGITLLTTSAKAASYKVVDSSSIAFLAHITGSSFTATNQSVSGSITTDETHTVTKGIIVIKAADFSSGMSTRDSHMREKYLETDKYPLITLDLTGAKLPASGVGAFDVEGTMDVKNVKKPVKMHVTVSQAGEVREAKSSFTIDITDYGIAQPKFAVVKMDTKVEVTVDVRFK